MVVSRALLLSIGALYLAMLVGVAWLSERSRRLHALARHPAIHALSLGVFASAWTYYGSFGFTVRHGLVFLSVYLGPTLVAVLLPIIGRPLDTLLRRERLGSLADLFAFRYRSRAIGLVVVLALVVSSLPYLAQQIRALTESVVVLTGGQSEHIVSIGYCVFVAAFACLFGMRRTGDPSSGLFVALALESLVKVLALLVVGVVAVTHVFGDLPGLARWLAAHPEAERALTAPVREDEGFTSLLLLSAAAGLLLPRQFYLLFHPETGPRAFRTEAWLFPAMLLALTLPTVPILLAAKAAGIGGPVDFTSLHVVSRFGSPWMVLLAFVGGLSASSAMILVTVLSVAELVVSHLVLPAQLQAERILSEERVAWLRRGVAVLVVLAGWLAYLFASRGPLVESAIPSFIAVAQFVPGLVGALAWKRATRLGTLLGLSAGLVVWFVCAQLPASIGPDFVVRRLLAAMWSGDDDWTLPAVLATSINAVLFIAVSLAFPAHDDEREAAVRCVDGAGPPDAAASVDVVPHASLEAELASVLGEDEAHDVVVRALAASATPGADLTRPHELARLRQAVQRELSARLGPVVARIVVDERLRREAAQLALADRLIEIEGRSHERVSRGIDLLHGVVRAVLEALPLGVAALGPDGAIVLWNTAMERLTGQGKHAVRGANATDLPAPWATLLEGGEGEHIVPSDRLTKILVVRRSVLDGAVWGEPGVFGEVVVVEDLTDQRSLEAQVAHGHRLAMLGRFAAGVAHEVGNPLTAIAFLAQNVARDATGEVRDRARDIVTQTRRIDGIVRSLLSYSREEGAPSVRSLAVRVSLDRLVAEALTLVSLDRTTRRVKGENLVPPDLTPLGRPQALLQVFVNLLTNAFDASPEGGLVLVDGFVERGQVVVRIVDSGAGIASENLERVFEPFFSTKAEDGTGLGLSLVKRIVDEHGGSVRVESQVGVGSAFIVTLPLAEEADE
ncbi:MAG: histidine kinase [Labilithrix sp.]|nr:histidine kinase [Labilithrix sp.]